MTAQIIRGDARNLPLADASVDLIVTSPPYWGLRDYKDGDASLAGQIGAEATPAEYVAALLECTAEWVRVLKPGGSLWVNLGDKYSQRAGQFGPQGKTGQRSTRSQAATYVESPAHRDLDYGTAPKSLLGLPWRYVLGCLDDLGLILRAEVIWSKPNGLPESVTDRVRRSHEQFFHFTRSPHYYAAVDEIRRPHVRGWVPGRNGTTGTHGRGHPGARPTRTLQGMQTSTGHPLGALPGSVWEVATQPLKVPAHLAVDHFAAFPPALIWPIILGWSPPGICIACGEGRRPISAADPAPTKDWALSQRSGRSWHGDGDTPTRTLGTPAADRHRRIIGHACHCPTPDAPTRPATVLDPFGGTGTTALVASVHGRYGISIDRSADYCRLATWRVNDPAERARALGVTPPPPVPDGQLAIEVTP